MGLQLLRFHFVSLSSIVCLMLMPSSCFSKQTLHPSENYKVDNYIHALFIRRLSVAQWCKRPTSVSWSEVDHHQ